MAHNTWRSWLARNIRTHSRGSETSERRACPHSRQVERRKHKYGPFSGENKRNGCLSVKIWALGRMYVRHTGQVSRLRSSSFCRWRMSQARYGDTGMGSHGAGRKVERIRLQGFACNASVHVDEGKCRRLS